MVDTGLRYGSYAGALLVAYGLIYRLAGVSPQSPLKWLFYLMLVVACVLAQRAHAASNRQSKVITRLATGSLTATVGGGIYGLYVYVYNRFVDDSLIRTVVADGRRAAEGDAGAQAFLDWLSSPAAFAVMIFAQMLVFGIVFSLVAALVTHRKMTE